MTEAEFLKIKAEAAKQYENCQICPRKCGVNRREGGTGVCSMPAELYAARAALHFWEEPCISGKEGSGAVFFSGCNLRCVFCQNEEVSHQAFGKEITIERLAEIFLELEQKHANNINLVTPDHYLPSVRAAMILARDRGLSIPFVVNCSGYETAESIRSLEGLADIYLDDFKYMETDKAERYSGAADYPERAKEALAEMVRQQPAPVFDERGLLQKGVIVRNLLMPGMVHNSEKVVKYVHHQYGNQVYLSLMHQFTPFPRLKDYPEINRTVTHREYERFVDYALSIGVEQAFIQEHGAAKESFIPNWDESGIDGPEISR